MFGKKILSIVGLLFLGSQLASALDCSAEYSGTLCTANNCVPGDDGKLILADGTGDVSANKYVVEIKSEGAECDLVTRIDGDDVCVSDKKVISTDLQTSFCTANACDSYMNCATTGICTGVKYTTGRVQARDPTLCNPSTEAKTNCDAGYYILDAATANANLVETGVEGTLWECKDSAGDCGVVDSTAIPYGYLKNQKSGTATGYIKCDGNGTSGTCTAILTSDIHKDDDNCTGNKPGDLIENGGIFKLCIDATIAPVALGITSTSPIKYFIGYDNTATNIFKTKMLQFGETPVTYYFMVDIQTNGNDVLLHAHEGEASKYKYTGADLKVVEYSDETRIAGICAGTSFTEFTKDYKSTDTVDYYVMGTPGNGPLHVDA